MKKASLLSLHTSVHSSGYRTHWYTEETYGALTIIPPKSKPSNRDIVLAEITALYHLLTVEEVAGKDRTGSDLKIELSRGAIKKILRNSEHKSSVYGNHLNWFQTQFIDAKLSVPKKQKANAQLIEKYLKSGADWDGRSIYLCEPMTLPSKPLVAPIYVPDIGNVVISLHAVKQFRKRNDMESDSKSWRKIRNMIANEKLVPGKLGDTLLAKKARKWDRSDAHFFNCARSWQLVLLPGESYWTLATLYQRPDLGLV